MDTFRHGGTLVDLETWYAGRDKVQHAMTALLVTRALLHWTPWHWLVVAVIVTVLGLLVEAIEDGRYQIWLLTGSDRRPRFCDRASWKDLVANTFGIALGFVF